MVLHASRHMIVTSCSRISGNQQGHWGKVTRLPDHTSTFLWSHTQISLATCECASVRIRTSRTQACNRGGCPISPPFRQRAVGRHRVNWHLVDEPEVVGHQHHAALEVVDGVRQRVDGLQVQMVCRLIQQQLQDSKTDGVGLVDPDDVGSPWQWPMAVLKEPARLGLRCIVSRLSSCHCAVQARGLGSQMRQ